MFLFAKFDYSRGWEQLIRIIWEFFSNLFSVPHLQADLRCVHLPTFRICDTFPSFSQKLGVRVALQKRAIVWQSSKDVSIMPRRSCSARWDLLHSTVRTTLLEATGPYQLFLLGCLHNVTPQGGTREPSISWWATLQKRASWLVRKLSRLLEASGLEDTLLSLWISNRPRVRTEGRLPPQSTAVWQS